MRYNSARDVLDTLVHAYYHDRDIAATLSCVTDDIEWVGTENNDSASGKQQLEALLKENVAAFPESFDVKIEAPTEQPIGTSAILFTLSGSQQGVDGISDGLAIRGTLCCIETEQGWLFNNIHTSVPNAQMEKYSLEKELELSIKQDMQRFKLVVDEVDAAVFEWNLRTGAFSSSAAYQKYAISQVSAEDILNNRGPKDIVHWEDQAILTEFFEETKSGKERIESILRLKTVDGDYHWCRLLGFFYKDKNGVPTHTVGMIIDIDEEHERGLMMSNILNEIPGGIGIFVFADTLLCDYYSDGFAKMAGITREEMDQKIADNTVLTSIISPVDIPTVVPALAENTAKGLPLNMTYRYIHGDGSTRWLHLTAEKMGERNGYPVYYCVFTTPTEETALYRNLTEDSVNGVAVFTYDTRDTLYMNSAAVHFYGLSNIAETEGKSFWTILKERGLKSLLTDEEIISLPTDDYARFHVRREEKYLVVRGKRLLWGGVDAYILYMIDETSEREKELELENLLNRIPTGISTYRIDAHGITQTFMNQGFYKTFDVTAGEFSQFKGANTLDAVAPEDVPVIKEAIAKLRAGENECDVIYRSVLPGRDTIWVRLIGTVAERRNDAFVLYAGTSDVTAQIQAQTRQKELFDTIPSGILEFFFDGKNAKVLSANQTLIDMIGFEEKEFYEKMFWTLSQVVHPEDYHLLIEARNSVTVGKGMTYDFRLLNKKTGLYRWISCDYTITERSKAGVKVISAFLDIDDKRKAEDASAAKSRFLSRMSHEIRTPINAIMGIAELEKQDIENHNVTVEGLDRYAKETVAASKYLLTLVNDILDTSRIENNQMEIQQLPVTVSQYLADIRTLIEPLVKEKKIDFKLERKTSMHESYIGDGVRVKQIIVNLLNNAIKFTPPGGQVRLACACIQETKNQATLQFTVADNGIGISEDFQKKLFVPFMQENSGNTSPYAGTGLGLSIARNLAQRMGGDITCTSEKGKGSTFTATITVGIPAGEENDNKESLQEQAEQEPREFEGVRILVFEDHPLNQKITQALLERKKCQVELAADGVIGVDMFEKHPEGYYSMILMDIRMPNMDGLQATAEIRSLNREDAKTIPIVAMSANAYDEDVQKSIAAGMNDHLAKPVNAAKLYSAVAHYTASKEKKDERDCILVVDDVEMNRAIIAKHLQRAYKVLQAADGVEALQLLECHPEIIGMVTDIQMPNLDGKELIQIIRNKYQFEDLAILVNTQYGDRQQENELITLGADDFVYKPNSPEILAVRLKNVLARRKHIL